MDKRVKSANREEEERGQVLLLHGTYKKDSDVRNVSRLDEKILDDGIFSPGHFDRP
ncbi:hypothetical protein ALC60_13648 [Trachymyrmex zeteki]|uniref:Uncharacterized protein n=1 Tax=Mycetomoellerius zeteki TaxID=64791 RepID=A0A151WHN9_9HYME|nr:hypothetical protein ALC60_13648 [Trachymyrmex zeteki]